MSEIDEKLLADSSSPSFNSSELGVDEQPEADIEEMLFDFDILYQPGIVFF